jgi:hypothetical protein
MSPAVSGASRKSVEGRTLAGAIWPDHPKISPARTRKVIADREQPAEAFVACGPLVAFRPWPGRTVRQSRVADQLGTNRGGRWSKQNRLQTLRRNLKHHQQRANTTV